MAKVADKLPDIKQERRADKTDQLYVHNHYNIKCFNLTASTALQPVIVRIFNAFIEALNKYIHPPKYLFVFADKDILSSIEFYDFNVRKVIRDNIYWLHKNLLKQLYRRRDDLKDKRLGAVNPEITKVIWVKMIERPRTDEQKLKQVLMLKGKFYRSAIQACYFS